MELAAQVFIHTSVFSSPLTCSVAERGHADSPLHSVIDVEPSVYEGARYKRCFCRVFLSMTRVVPLY